MSKTKQTPPVIESLLDTDLYKFFMMQAVWKKFPDTHVKFKFKCRNKGIDFREFYSRINKEIDHLCTLKFQPDEMEYLLNLKSVHGTNLFGRGFVEFLSLFKMNRGHIRTSIDEDGELNIEIEGPWLMTILFEVPVLAIVNEVYFSQYGTVGEKGHENLEEMIALLLSEPLFSFSEFGTRRRYSRVWQEWVLRRIMDKAPGSLVGTSNVYFAWNLGLTPIGTMAHEWLQAGQALARLRDSVTYMLDAWMDVYRGDLGIALTDVISSKVFFEDFDLLYSKLFDGVRHDSGDPVDYGYMAIEHYEGLSIDPRSKTVVFSDGLTIASAIDLFREFLGKIKTGYGIGTSVTNNVGVDALNIVIKMTFCNGQPVAKISDSPGKGMCEDDIYVNTLRRTYGLPPIEERQSSLAESNFHK